MLLFHYTTERNKTGIFEVGEIRPSVPVGLSPGGISLTSDKDPVGHGLPDGRQISPEQAKHLEHEIIGGVPYCWDHTKFRLTIPLDDHDPNLVRAINHHTAEELLGLDISAYHPEDLHPPDLKFLLIARGISEGTLVRKSPTWWYYKRSIPVSRIVAIEARDASGTYVEVVR